MRPHRRAARKRIQGTEFQIWLFCPSCAYEFLADPELWSDREHAFGGFGQQPGLRRLLLFPKIRFTHSVAALLDPDSGGFFSLTPAHANFKSKQMYLPQTNILLTRFLCEDGIVEVTDFMPVGDAEECHCLIRKVSAIGAAASIEVKCSPKI